jgi:hypothetical protein
LNSASTWRLRTVAQAADMNPRALRQAFEIGALKLSGNDKKSSGSGSYIGLSKPRAYQAAIMKHLHRVGLSIPQAARAAFEFSNVGNIGRAPGELYKHGRTALVVTPEGATVTNIFSDTTDITNSAVCAITVSLNKVIEHVNAVLLNNNS